MHGAGCSNTAAGLQLIHSVQDLLRSDVNVARTIDDTLWLRIPAAVSQTSIQRAVPGLRFILSQYPQYASGLVSSLLTSSTYELGRALPLNQQRLAMGRAGAMRLNRGSHHRWWFANQSSELTGDDIEKLFREHPSAFSMTLHPKFPWSVFDSNLGAHALRKASSDPGASAPFIEADVVNRILREIDEGMRERVFTLMAASPLLDAGDAEGLLVQASGERNRAATAALLGNSRMAAAIVEREWAIGGMIDDLSAQHQLRAAGHPRLSREVRGPFIKDGTQDFFNSWEKARVMRHDDVLDAVNPDQFLPLAATAGHQDVVLFEAMAEAGRMSPLHWEALASGSTTAKTYFASQTQGKVELPATRRVVDSASAMLRIETPEPVLDATSTWDDLPGADWLPVVLPVAIAKRARLQFRDVTISAVTTKIELDSLGSTRWLSSLDQTHNPSVVVKAERGGQVYAAVIAMRDSEFVVKRTSNITENARDLPEWATDAFENAARVWTAEQEAFLGLR